MRTSNENERLRDNGNLKVDDGVQLPVIVVDLARGGIQMDVELPLEEVRLKDDDNKNDPMQAIRTRVGMKKVRTAYVDSVK